MQLNKVINTTRLLRWSTIPVIRSNPPLPTTSGTTAVHHFPINLTLNYWTVNDKTTDFFSRDYCLQKQNTFLVHIGMVWYQQVAANNRNLTQIITWKSVFIILPLEGLVKWRKRSAVFYYCSNWTFTTCYLRIHTHFFSKWHFSRTSSNEISRRY